jgi:DNA-directed RNA polymerase specialized sigma subunit
VYRTKRTASLEGTAVPEDGAERPDQSALANERAELVRRAIGELPPRQRMALVLKHYEYLSYEEIAAALRCSTRQRPMLDQTAHHKDMTFEHEYLSLLKKYGVPYDPERVFD